MLAPALSGGCARSSPQPEPTAVASAALPAEAPPGGPATALTSTPPPAPPPSAAPKPAAEAATPSAGLPPAGPSAGASAKNLAGSRTRASCDACKGLWARHGVAEHESCNCRTRDVGKTCRDGRDCQGYCLADAAGKQVVDKGPPARGYFIGKCSEFETPFGCHRLLEDGVAKEGPKNLSELPPEMCVD